jgi:hypothetical protein
MLLQNHKGDPIEDEALLKQAELFELEGPKAENYQKITGIRNGILADDALYHLECSMRTYRATGRSKKLYEKIIYNHADSIYFIDVAGSVN